MCWAGFGWAVTEGLYRVNIHIISSSTHNRYTSSQYFTVCCLYNSFTKLFCLALVFIYSMKCCRNAEQSLCRILLLVASDFRLHLPVLMHRGDKLLLGFSSGCLSKLSLSASCRFLLKQKYFMWCVKNLKLHEFSVFIAYSPENQSEQRATPVIDGSWCGEITQEWCKG